MANSEIYVRSQGKDYGPFEIEQLKGHLKTGDIPFHVWLYINDTWRMLAESEELRSCHPDFESKPTDAPGKSAIQDIAKVHPKAEPVKLRSVKTGTVSTEPLWFVIRDKKKHGPFSAADIIEQLQNKRITRSAFIWRPGYATWQKLGQVGEFSKSTMQKIASQKTSMDILVKRKFPRAPYEVKVIAHDNKKAIQGKSMVIGEGGMFLSTVKPQHKIGSRLKIHFRDDKLPSFNVVAEIISVVRSGTMPGYCLKFVAISAADKKRIGKYTQETKRKEKRS